VQKVIRVTTITPRQREILTTTSHLATLRIVRRGDNLFAQVGYKVEEPETASLDDLLADPKTVVMGVDLGIKCPAVSYSTNGKVRFFGNGRENRYKRRKFYARRKKLQKAKKLRAIKRISDKEARFMRDRDHQVSRAIVNEAIRQGANVIALEDLDGIRENCTPSTPTRKSRKNIDKPKVDSVVTDTTKTGEPVQLDLFSESEVLTKKQRRKKHKLSKKQVAVRKKNNRSLNSWSFYQLTKFIEYKAALAGILVIRVNPYKTSQRCPSCGREHKAKDRWYECECGFHAHRDLVGAINIAKNALKR
jgi:transposase, IS605 orfB family